MRRAVTRSCQAYSSGEQVNWREVSARWRSRSAQLRRRRRPRIRETMGLGRPDEPVTRNFESTE
jgi:hypothetical protein